ncbi:DUF4912 domain-containing protein [Alicyclobacillus ferrooxydans]|uniref:DUF4912 domain-containing protein n=1 Tax=Alicyclobacillus ferrooxydans TaxID=471514 RepID=UPI0006D5A20F|nr:DUF4912 domain-containing protein [Alicyclobacillus ferrooxydans]
MDRREGNEAIWTEIALRIARGEKQAAIARELGMKAGTFRYQLKKFLALNCQAASEIAATLAAVETSTPDTNDEEVSEQDSYPGTLFDESWTRKWCVSRLVLLVKEPTTLHAYWEVDDPKRELVTKHFQSQWTDLPFFLQLYDVTDIHFNGYNAHSTIRIPVPPDADNWYVHGVQPLRRYLMDFGTTTWNGDFFTILRSNTVGTPPKQTYRHPSGQVQFAPLASKSAHNASSVQNSALESAQCNRLSENPSGSPRPYPDEFDGYTVRTRGQE